MLDGDEENWEALPRVEVSEKFKKRHAFWDEHE